MQTQMETTSDFEYSTDIEDTIEENEEKLTNEAHSVDDEISALHEDILHKSIEKFNEQSSQSSSNDMEDKALSSVAATAQSLQPTGHTLETTTVKMPIPVLIKKQTASSKN